MGEMIPLKDYAEMHGRNGMSAAQKAIRGGFKTARKIGRQWFIDADEPYVDRRFSNEDESIVPKKQTPESN